MIKEARINGIIPAPTVTATITRCLAHPRHGRPDGGGPDAPHRAATAPVGTTPADESAWPSMEHDRHHLIHDAQ